MSRTRWFRDANDRERPPWRKRSPARPSVQALHAIAAGANPDLDARVERCSDIIASGPPEPYVEPDWSTMTNATAWSVRATSGLVMEDILRALDEMNRLTWRTRDGVEIGVRMPPIEYKQLLPMGDL